jgi:hypothetical protein
MNLGVFVLGGVILIAAGILQLMLRPRPSGARSAFDGTIVRTALFVIVGVLAVLVGLGVVPLARL